MHADPFAFESIRIISAHEMHLMWMSAGAWREISVVSMLKSKHAAKCT